MSYLYDETARRLEKDLRPNAWNPSGFHYEMAALDDPRAARVFRQRVLGSGASSKRSGAPALWNNSTAIKASG